jgi:hypothetical protein
MKPRDLQFGVRKNPDSPRVHGLRLAIDPMPTEELKELQKAQNHPHRSMSGHRIAEKLTLPLIRGTNEATGESSRWRKWRVSCMSQSHGSTSEAEGAGQTSCPTSRLENTSGSRWAL